MKLKAFLRQIKQANSSLEMVQLSLKQNGNVKKLLAALNDETNVGCQNISELDLSGSKLTDDDIETLVKTLNKFPNIKTLRLDNCAITDDHTLRHLIELEHVTRLSLKSNLLGTRPTFNKGLKALYLDDNPNLKVKSALLRFSTYATKLEVLSLNQCDVNDDDLNFIMRKGSHLKTLKQLHLHENKLSSIGVLCLTEMNLLEVLDLGKNNQIGDYGISKLQCPVLRTLDIEGCNLSPHVFESLEAMTKLRTVNLSYNPALKSYEKADAKSNRLEQIKKVKLNFCQLNNDHAPLLTALFPNLTHLEVANNQLTHVGVEDLLIIEHLQSLDVSTNSMFSILSAISQKAPRANKTIAVEKAKIEELLLSVSQAKKLIHINLSGTGLPDDMLPSFIPAEGSARKLRSINGIPCVELKDVLKQREEAKKNALAAQAVAASSASADGVVEIEAKPSKGAQIKTLKAQVKDLKAQLAEAKATITQLQGAKLSDVPHEQGRVLKQVAQLETKVSTQSMFASTARKSKQEKAVTNANVIAESSFSS
jgi:Leucine-rich repeat (LRR) protein